ncbi:hypothetical protein BCR36DRAFT_416329 [Piromyces finnis]|uniref:AMP-activated protein kinase glycogen-binding domain-containing protein n=1 Tax=Piromyces finnis TaxID=1754191 RepID=A0A1Y1UVF2_9FUNG|nr:hypothetical protein BCR36DRAFT_416329 [Piromyces finnis]|eukprot:ORX42022.1 hypothetical protein BCR36DRAFT_416329 [Piromyces finnis]
MSIEHEAIKKSSKFISYTIDYPIRSGKIPEPIENIRVIGEFGSWSGWLDMKKSSDDEKYTADVNVRPGTTIKYKFLINGKYWTSVDAADSEENITDQDGHVMIVKKVLDTDDSSINGDASEIVESTKTEEPAKTTTTTTTTDNSKESVKTPKKEKKSFFKKLFGCCL